MARWLATVWRRSWKRKLDNPARSTAFSNPVRNIIDRELHELQYKSVGEWFSRLQAAIRFQALSDAHVARVAEIKASRDILAHNVGIVDEIYLRKAGDLARAGLGEKLPITRPYTYDSADFLRGVVASLADIASQQVRATHDSSASEPLPPAS